MCESLGTTPVSALLGRYADGEIRVEIQEKVRGQDMYVIQSACRPVNDHLMELLIMVDALKRASAQRINVIMPYYAYARQDQKDKPRSPITARLVADLVSRAGADRIVSLDLHAGQIQGFFAIPVDDLAVLGVFVDDLRDKVRGDEVVVAPDSAGVVRARAFAKVLNLDLAIMDFRRVEEDRAVHIVGNVAGRPVIIVDDMIDSGRTLERSVQAVAAAGARRIDAYCVHPVFSGKAVERLGRLPLESLTVADTIPLAGEAMANAKVRVVSIAPILAQVIRRLHTDQPINSYLH